MSRESRAKPPSLGLIVTELVINALKHAYPDDRSGTIKVGYAGDGEGGGWMLEVADDGVGMSPAGGKPATAGRGTSLVEALVPDVRNGGPFHGRHGHPMIARPISIHPVPRIHGVHGTFCFLGGGITTVHGEAQSAAWAPWARSHGPAHEHRRHAPSPWAHETFHFRIAACTMDPGERRASACIAKIWTSEPDRFIVDPIHQIPGLNT